MAAAKLRCFSSRHAMFPSRPPMWLPRGVRVGSWTGGARCDRPRSWRLCRGRPGYAILVFLRAPLNPRLVTVLLRIVALNLATRDVLILTPRPASPREAWSNGAGSSPTRATGGSTSSAGSSRSISSVSPQWPACSTREGRWTTRPPPSEHPSSEKRRGRSRSLFTSWAGSFRSLPPALSFSFSLSDFPFLSIIVRMCCC